MSGRRFGGVLAPITTPFDPATGDVRPGALRQNITLLLEAGLDGIVVAGSTGEAPLLDADEQRRLVACARDAVPRDRWLFAGTGAESTREAVARSRAAAVAGADAVLVRPPGYFAGALTPAALVDYFRAVGDACPVPVLVYNIPKYTHLAIAPAVLEQLAAHPNILGVKDSSGDVKNLGAYRAAVPEWLVFVGSGSLFYAALELGCDGGILALACFAARRCVDLFAAFRAGDRARAEALQQPLIPLNKAIVSELGAAGVKAAMDAVGLTGGPVRAPLPALAPADRERVVRLLTPGD